MSANALKGPILVTPAKPPPAQLAAETSEHNDLAISLITRLCSLLIGYQYHCLHDVPGSGCGVQLCDVGGPC